MTDMVALSLFIPTFFFVSITPGLCMTLALTMGMTFGIRTTLWMMTGELLGVGLVAAAAVLGVAALVVKYPDIFIFIKYIGGGYLAFIGVQMWMSKGRMAIDLETQMPTRPNRIELAVQGFVTAISNPKAWAFMISLLPPFINMDQLIAPQLGAMVALILAMEFACMLIYALGGKTLRVFLQNTGNVRLLNRIAGTLMIGVGGWLAFL